ncbi:putative membrane protein YkvI [Lysinibacillus parviboronicapiens]|uniref:Membrane protein YkvI n=1 Tax=Lysinibacillus parviboronicapiens TaxID=436516 RepID=A0ABV2PPZ8_9BACI
MKKSWQIGGAFVGLIVGAGFASGQEIMQYFTSFGLYGIAGAIVATIAFAFLGMSLAQLGTDLQTTSHKKVIYHIGGRYVGVILDILITFFLFGVAVVMFAGSGSTFHQMFGINPMVGSIIMVILTILTLLLNVKNIINIIALVTPYLMAIIFIILVYSIFTMDLTIAQQEVIAREQTTAAPNWFMGALLYVSYNIAAGAAMLIVMGGTLKDRKVAGLGGLLGGLMLGGLILLINIAMFVKLDVVNGVAMPTLELAKQIHPVVGVLMSIALLGMMYNTAVGMFYAFTVRFVAPEHKYFKPSIVVIGLLGFAASLVGFTTLVGKVYSTMGYLGFALIIAVIIAWIRKVPTVA